MRLPPRITRFVLGCTLAAACLAGCDPQPTGPSPSPPAPPEITSADATTCAPPICDQIVATVALTWRPSTSAITGYRVLRDGEEIAALPPVGPASTSVEDRSAVIGATHRYEVVAVGDGGTRGRSTPTDVVVPLPPLEAAQVEGAFRVTRRVTRAKNLKELEGISDPHPGVEATTDWTFVATCPPAVGACPIRWNGHPGLLAPDGALYRGDSAAGFARCPGGGHVRAPIRFRIRVTEGRVVGGAWVASEIRGRLASAFACPGFAPSSGAARFVGVRR
ncbi:MAG: hypothetical protein ACXWE5_02840 [Actinomycetota bacterium]